MDEQEAIEPENTEAVLATAAAESNKMGKVLQHAVKIVRVGLPGIIGYRKVDDAKIFIDDEEQDKTTFTTPSVKIVPKEWTSKFATILHKALFIIRSYSPKNSADMFPLPGCSVVLASKMEILQAQIDALIEAEMNPLINSFVEAYPGIVNDLKLKLANKPNFQAMIDALPKAEDMRKKIRLLFFPVPITFLTQAGKEFADAIVQSTVHGLSKELSEKVDHLVEIVDKDKGNLRKKSIDNMKAIFQKMQDFSFVTSPEVAEKLKQAQVQFDILGDDAHTTINEAIKAKQTAIVTGLKTALNELTKEVKTDAGGRFRRKINV